MTPAALLELYAPGRTDPVLAAQLAALWASAHEIFPGVQFDAATSPRHLASLGHADLTTIHGLDVFLADACLEGDAAAIRHFEARVIGPLGPALASVDSRPEAVDELRQRVRARLLVAEPGRTPRLAEYRGEASLARWARTVAVRLMLNERRDSAREVQTDDEVLERRLVESGNLELRYVREAHRAHFAEALKEALAAMEPRARTVLRMAFVDHLSIDRIGEFYGTHRATAASWLSAAREALGLATRQRLGHRLQLSDGEVASLLRDLDGNLEVSLRRLLA